MPKQKNYFHFPKLTEESQRAIGNTYEKLGSIRKCQDIHDFGEYRYTLVYEFDKIIRKLKKELRKWQKK